MRKNNLVLIVRPNFFAIHEMFFFPFWLFFTSFSEQLQTVSNGCLYIKVDYFCVFNDIFFYRFKWHLCGDVTNELAVQEGYTYLRL